MMLRTAEEVRNYLMDAQITRPAEELRIESLSGGVSSLVWKVVRGNDRWVIKQALEKLKVEADWYADVERIHREHEVMEMLSPLVPAGTLPEVLHTDYVHHVYLMTCAEDSSRTWKDRLMEGDLNPTVAANAGKLLGELHRQSHRISEAGKRKLEDQHYFNQLRVDPFHRYLISKHPGLASSIQKLIDEITIPKTCLVHGDFSPKNMLVEEDGNIVLIDFEVAHWGNPVFDLAFCLGHLMLKGWYLNKPEEMVRMIETFLEAYGTPPPNLTAHLGLMQLARMDGKSTVGYIQEEKIKSIIRTVAISWIRDGQTGDTIEHIRKAFH